MKRLVLLAAAAISLLPLMGKANAGDTALPTLEQYARAHPPANPSPLVRPTKTTHHSWFYIDYAEGKCKPSPSPAEEYDYYSTPAGHMTGLSLDRITPDDVFKVSDDDIHVTAHGKQDGKSVSMDFFTVKATCDNYVEVKGIKPEQANGSDIN